MLYLRNSILATVAYYDCLSRPLTLVEIYKYLINPSRISKINNGIGNLSLVDVSDEIDKLYGLGMIGEKDGFYFLSGRESLYNLRIKRDLIAYQKWKKFLRIVKFLALAPFLRGVFASGSLALNNTDGESDFDVLIVAKSGRLYTCRLFLWLISSLLGVRRKKDEKIAPDKLCFNHYITDSDLYIPHESLFNAQTYANLKPAMIELKLIDKFYSANLWINNYLYNFQPQNKFLKRSVSAPETFKFITKRVELLLDLTIGNFVEKRLKQLQQNKIRSNPTTYKSGGRIVFNDKELEFHPYSFEKTVLTNYKEKLKKLGIVPFIEERDSGLT